MAALWLRPALRDARNGRTALVAARDALRRQDAATARRSFAAASASLDRARAELGPLPVRLVAHVPVAGRSVRSARDLVDAARALARAGPELVAALESRPPGGWGLRGGGVDIAAVARAAGHLRAAVPALREARARVEAAPSTWLFPPVARERRDALIRVVAAERDARLGAEAAELIPSLLGSDGPRRYFLAVANLSELRGTGGFLGYFAVLRADHGTLSLERVGRPAEDLPPPSSAHLDVPQWYVQAYARRGGTTIWQSVNVTADFPTAASVAVQSLRQPGSVGGVDGVVQIDPVGLQTLLRLTGPVSVPPWPEPVDASRVSSIAQHDAYVRFGDDSDRRYAFLGRVVAAVAGRAFAGELRLDAAALSRFADAARAGHVHVYSVRGGEQDVLRDLGVSPGVARASSATDVMGFVTENWSGTKIDWYLHRTVSYEARLEPSSRMSVRGTVGATLANDAPSQGLPAYVIGPYNTEVPAGWSRQLVLWLRPPTDQLGAVRVDGRTAPVTRDNEAALRSYSQFVSVPPGGRALVRGSFAVPDGLRGRGRSRTYRLLIPHQPVLNADRYRVRIVAPKGWKASGPTSFTGRLDHDLVLTVRIRQSVRAWLFETIVLGPFRLARRLL